MMVSVTCLSTSLTTCLPAQMNPHDPDCTQAAARVRILLWAVCCVIVAHCCFFFSGAQYAMVHLQKCCHNA